MCDVLRCVEYVNNYIVRSYINKNNRLAMNQFSDVLLASDKAHTVPQRALDCGPGITQVCMYWA